jgi:hypothetical protein
VNGEQGAGSIQIPVEITCYDLHGHFHTVWYHLTAAKETPQIAFPANWITANVALLERETRFRPAAKIARERRIRELAKRVKSWFPVPPFRNIE